MIIELNDRQARLIETALEQHSRMICGQLSETYLPSLRHAMMKEHKNFDKYIETRDVVDVYLTTIKKLIWGLNKNASYGIGYDEEADLGYEMYKQILHYFKNKRQEKEGGEYLPNVHTYTPLDLTDEPKIKIKL